VAVDVKAGVGAHSAILEVDDPKTATVDYETMNTVVVSNDVKAPDFAFSTEGAVDRNSYTSFFVTVPEGAAALQVNLSGIATGSQTRFIAMNPYGVPVENTSSLACYTNRPPGPPCNPQERDYQNPLPGIWEIEIESRRTSPALSNPYLVTARVQGVAVTPAVVQLPSVPANTPTAVSWSLKNTFGPVKVTGKGGSLGSALTSRPTIADQETQTFHVTVPAGASRLDVVIGNPSDPAADLDLTVRLGNTVVGQSADGDSEEAVSIANPAAGTYDVEIDGFAVPAGTTQYDYRDVYFAAGLGTITVPSTQITLAHGGTGTLTGSVSARPNPPAGRQLFGEATLVTVPEGAVVGRGSVVIGAVN